MITKLDKETFNHASMTPIYFGVKRSKGQGYEAQKTVPAWVSALL